MRTRFQIVHNTYVQANALPCLILKVSNHHAYMCAHTCVCPLIVCVVRGVYYASAVMVSWSWTALQKKQGPQSTLLTFYEWDNAFNKLVSSHNLVKLLKRISLSMQ